MEKTRMIRDYFAKHIGFEDYRDLIQASECLGRTKFDNTKWYMTDMSRSWMKLQDTFVIWSIWDAMELWRSHPESKLRQRIQWITRDEAMRRKERIMANREE